ncbi:TetR/AcrR family transcriptional regulator [Nocardioides sp.]|uniref:TetR/AcrR family transcriptional regulator n=1 Tax=Nocardioides sp. TaxID=35761 RepID=UPI0035194710
MTTKERLLAATLRVLAEQGIAKVSARTIAAEAGVNQALVFYHYGSIDDLLAAACDAGSAARVDAHRDAVARVGSVAELVALARRIHAEERREGSVAVIGQLLAGASSHPTLAEPTARGLERWVVEVERTLTRLLSATVLADLPPDHPSAVDVAGLARALSAAFVGLELYEGVDAAGADAAFDALEQVARLVGVLEQLGPLERAAVRRRLRRG